MTTTATTEASNNDLDALLNELSLGAAADEIIEPAEEILEAAVSRAEAQEEVSKHYEAEAAETTIEAAAPVDVADLFTAPPATEPAAEAAPAPEKKKREKKAKAEGEEKKPATTRKYYSSKAERVTDKLGADLGDYTVLELADAALTGDELKAKQDETMKALKDAGKKVQNRMTFIMEFAAGKSPKLNGVIQKALELLKKDGKIVMGEKGNFYTCLIAHPYSPAAAKAMGGNSVLAMKALKMIQQGEDKLTYVANPNSLYLAKLNSMLGL